jgi:hypothetical protein
MSHRVVTLGLAALSLLTGRAAAGELPIRWSYRNPLAEMAFAEGATGGLTFPNTVFQSLTGSAEITATQVASYSIAPDTAPDKITSLPYRFSLELRDDLSGEVARLTFAGVFTGDIWRTGSELAARYTGPTSQSVRLGGNQYGIELGGFAPPAGYGDESAGSISARVTVSEYDPPKSDPDPTDAPPVPDPADGGPVSSVNTPEPGTALLVLIGLPAVGAVRALRRRR